MEFFNFFLSLKENGTFRTIGLLSEIYRIWAKLRMPLVRAWGAGVPRAFFAAGVGKSTEDSIGRVLLHGETISTAEEAAVIVADIDKCYENVSHEKLRKAAIQHKFPLAILRLCMKMYRAARTVCWDGVFSNFVHSSQTLVPGCSIALWLLQLVMITPIDEFIHELPRHIASKVHNLEIFVDDSAMQVTGPKGQVEDAMVYAAKGLLKAFEESADLPISRTKGRVAATTTGLAEKIAARLKSHGFKAVRAMKILGVDNAAGKGGMHGQSGQNDSSRKAQKPVLEPQKNGRQDKKRAPGSDNAGGNARNTGGRDATGGAQATQAVDPHKTTKTGKVRVSNPAVRHRQAQIRPRFRGVGSPFTLLGKTRVCRRWDSSKHNTKSLVEAVCEVATFAATLEPSGGTSGSYRVVFEAIAVAG